MNIIISTNDLKSARAFGTCIASYMYNHEDCEISWDNFPDKMKLYYSYLDTDERKEIHGSICCKTGITIACFNGDLYITDGDRNCITTDYFGLCKFEFVSDSHESNKFYEDIAEIYEFGCVSGRIEKDD